MLNIRPRSVGLPYLYIELGEYRVLEKGFKISAAEGDPPWGIRGDPPP